MKNPECESVRDHLPEWVGGALDGEELARVEEHLSSCPGCRGEEEVVRALLEIRPEAPVGLEARIQARLREELSVDGEASGKNARIIPFFGRRRWAPTWAFSAAALVVLSLGIGVIWDGQAPEVTLDPMEVAVQEPLPEAWLWDDGMVAGAPVYDGLTDEQLETLIQELEG
jgi:hypothetical protein